MLGVLPGVIGLLQATETIKLLLDLGEPLGGRLLHFDALAMRFREMRLRPDPDCVVCAPGVPSPATSTTPDSVARRRAEVCLLDMADVLANVVLPVDARWTMHRRRRIMVNLLGQMDFMEGRNACVP